MCPLHSTLHLESYFNSIVVQLKLENPKIAVEVLLFQFHNGTIKTISTVKTSIKRPQFQFHNGTIKTDSHDLP